MRNAKLNLTYSRLNIAIKIIAKDIEFKLFVTKRKVCIMIRQTENKIDYVQCWYYFVNNCQLCNQVSGIFSQSTLMCY